VQLRADCVLRREQSRKALGQLFMDGQQRRALDMIGDALAKGEQAVDPRWRRALPADPAQEPLQFIEAAGR
jgi:hypothetical protein